MLLAVDVGNTQTVIGLSMSGKIVDDWRMATVRHRTGDEIAGLLAGFLSLAASARARSIDEVAIASVVPRLTMQWIGDVREAPRRVAVRRRTRHAHRHADPHEEPSRGRRRPHRQRGGRARDVRRRRASSSTSARRRTSTSSSADGDYMGGAIAPGIEVSMEALTTRAAKLIKVDLIEPEHAIGKSTTEGLQSGAVYGFAGQVEGIVAADPRRSWARRRGWSPPAVWPS